MRLSSALVRGQGGGFEGLMGLGVEERGISRRDEVVVIVDICRYFYVLDGYWNSW